MKEVQRKDQCPTILKYKGSLVPLPLPRNSKKGPMSYKSSTKRLFGSSSSSLKKGAVSYKSTKERLSVSSSYILQVQKPHTSSFRGQQDVVLSVSKENHKPQCSQPFSNEAHVSLINSITLPDICCRLHLKLWFSSDQDIQLRFSSDQDVQLWFSSDQDIKLWFSSDQDVKPWFSSDQDKNLWFSTDQDVNVWFSTDQF